MATPKKRKFKHIKNYKNNKKRKTLCLRYVKNVDKVFQNIK